MEACCVPALFQDRSNYITKIHVRNSEDPEFVMALDRTPHVLAVDAVGEIFGFRCARGQYDRINKCMFDIHCTVFELENRKMSFYVHRASRST